MACGPMRAYDVLSKLKWHPEFSLSEARVTILHRGAPGDVRIVRGDDILELGRAFMRIRSPEGEVEIPYHRILRIETKGKSLWQKRRVS